uniref:Protein IQ-DOMAIN 31 n=1 Tax=Anthurium amnicola TaxID=1678845 RepID=A0A1D1YL24_9ARAE
MGKSPGKWIKTLLFGKKSVKSRTFKGRSSKSANSNDWRGCEGPALALGSPVISKPVPVNADQIGTNMELETEVTPSLPCGDLILPEHEDPEERGTTVFNVPNEPERAREEQAAIKTQAAFRGYLARRAFRALKGIIRLQAVVRGHLVRRQAVVTLHCMWGIVKFQALVHGKRVRHDLGFEDVKHAGPFAMNLSSLKEKADVNAFVRKLLSLSTIAKPLEVQFCREELNSVWSWLERWSTSRFWKPPPQQKKIVDSKPQRRHYATETESGRPKRSVRRNFGMSTETGSNIMIATESEKPRRNIRKVSSHPADTVQESPQSELEKVKRNLRKVTSSMGESSDRVQVETEKPNHSLRKISNSTLDALDQGAEISAEEVKKDVTNLILDTTQCVETILKNSVGEREAIDSPVDIFDEDAVDFVEKIKKDVKLAPDTSQNVEISSIPVVTDGQMDVVDHTAFGLHPPQNCWKDESNDLVNGELNSEEQVPQDNQKASKRRASFSTKSEYTENGSQNATVLPSYMAITKSAKAKVRGQNSPRFGSDGTDRNAFPRRHSLPSSTTGRLTSLSPRTQRLVPTSCKGGIRSERSLLSSRDGSEKPIHVEWRR